jgi:hypothetical protein
MADLRQLAPPFLSLSVFPSRAFPRSVRGGDLRRRRSGSSSSAERPALVPRPSRGRPGNDTYRRVGPRRNTVRRNRR